MDSLALRGIKVKRRGNAARMVVGRPVLHQALAVILCLAGLIGLAYAQSEGEFPRGVPPWAIWAGAGTVAICVLYWHLFHHMLVTIKGRTVAVERRPLPLPPPFQVKLEDIKSIDTDVKVTTRRDKYGEEHDSFRFTVQLSLESDWRPRRLYKTGSENAAVTFRKTLVMMVDNARAMNQSSGG